MQVSPSLRALLGPLEDHLRNPAVSEVLVSHAVYVTSLSRVEKLDLDFPESRLRALADRLVRALSLRPGAMSPSGGRSNVRRGLLDEEHEVLVVGDARAARCPIVRVVRRAPPAHSLDAFVAAGGMDPAAQTLLRGACANHLSMIVTGLRGTGKTALIASLAREWQSRHRVAVLEPPEGMLKRAGIGHLWLDPETGTGDALALAADVIVVDHPESRLWLPLLASGRAFIAGIEASDARAALARIVAFVLGSEPLSSRAAVEGLVESAVDLVVETARNAAEPRIGGVLEPYRDRPDADLNVRPARARSRVHGGSLLTGPPPVTVKSGVPSRNAWRKPRSSDAPLPAVPEPRLVEAHEASEPDIDPILGALAAFGSESRGPPPSHDAGGFAPFEASEVSEIRAEQLVSHSFVMNLGDLGLGPKPASPSVVAPDASADESERTDNGLMFSNDGEAGSVRERVSAHEHQLRDGLGDPDLEEKEETLSSPGAGTPSLDLTPALGRRVLSTLDEGARSLIDAALEPTLGPGSLGPSFDDPRSDAGRRAGTGAVEPIGEVGTADLGTVESEQETKPPFEDESMRKRRTNGARRGASEEFEEETPYSPLLSRGREARAAPAPSDVPRTDPGRIVGPNAEAFDSMSGDTGDPPSLDPRARGVDPPIESAPLEESGHLEIKRRPRAGG